MDLLKKIDELLYNFSIKLGIQNTHEAKIFISEIIIFSDFSSYYTLVIKK
jgi:hypothetical protein